MLALSAPRPAYMQFTLTRDAEEDEASGKSPQRRRASSKAGEEVFGRKLLIESTPVASVRRETVTYLYSWVEANADRGLVTDVAGLKLHWQR